VLRGDHRRDVGPALLEQLADAEHDVGALAERRRAPRRERLARRIDRGVDLGHVGEVDLVRLHAGRRIEHGSSPPRLAGNVLAADVVPDAFHGSTPSPSSMRGRMLPSAFERRSGVARGA
jgi:hypothetical protein